LEEATETTVGVPHNRDKLVVHALVVPALVAADRRSQIPAVQKKITEAEAEKRRPVDAPLSPRVSAAS